MKRTLTATIAASWGRPLQSPGMFADGLPIANLAVTYEKPSRFFESSDVVTTLYRHITCESPVLRYMGDGDPHTPIRARDWQAPDGRRFEPGTAVHVSCPDCGEPVQMNPRWLVPMSHPNVSPQ